jgi:hypothetical protein
MPDGQRLYLFPGIAPDLGANADVGIAYQVSAKQQQMQVEAEQLKPKEEVKNEVEVFHGGTIDKPEDLAEGEPLFVSESKSQAKEYTKENEGKVKGFKIDKNKIATEEEARDVIKKLDLKPKEEGWDAEELNLFELIDPKFETSLSEDDIQKCCRSI